MSAETTGFVHAAGFYEGDHGLLPLVVPFVRAGVDAGEPVVIALGGEHAELARSVLPPSPDVTYLPDGYARPAGIVSALLGVLRAHADTSPGRIRIVGELALDSLGPATWGPWARYEAAVNHLYAPFAATAMCAYDTTTMSDRVLADVVATHPDLAEAGGSRSNGLFQDPVAFLQRATAPRDLLESTEPAVETFDPDPALARQSVHAAAEGCAIAPDVLEDLVVGVSEVVTNARLYGRAPVVLRVWAAPDRMIAVVSDRGAGPSFPYAGLVPVEGNSPGGRGLWITHQICGQVDHLVGPDGFAVRLSTSPPEE
ncbi:MAG TPA: sensor histidine kinase [Jatrophihabitantaceae bacterium]|nr:sensor histidine kinase [Jatrophihabitantaceae bacterium]